RLDLPRPVPRLVGDLEGVELALAAGLDPPDVAGLTPGAQDARVEEHVAARPAAGQAELALAQAVPERLGLGRLRRRQRAIDVHDGLPGRRSRRRRAC